MGSRHGSAAAAAVMAALATGPEHAPPAPGAADPAGAKGKGPAVGDSSDSNAALTHAIAQSLVAAGALRQCPAIAADHSSTLAAKAAAATVMKVLLASPAGSSTVAKAEFLDAGGLTAVHSLLTHPAIGLMAKAHAAGIKV